MLVLLGALPLALLPIAPWILAPVLAYDLLLAGLEWIESARLPRAIRVRRILPALGYQGETLRARREISAAGAGTLRILLLDEAGAAFAPVTPRRLATTGGAADRSEIFPLLPIRRGAHRLGPVRAEWTGPWGLVRRIGRSEKEGAPEIRILPARDLATRARGRVGTTPAGALLAVRASEGLSFDAFRTYVPGDDFRRIDWKASARRGALHVRTFRPERGQSVVCVLDAGRGGAFPVGSDSVPLLLDHAAAASAALVAAARAEGDRVGVLSYDAAVRDYLPPGAGAGHHRAVLHLLSEIEPERAEGDPQAVLAYLERKLPRRSLILLFTEAGDPASSGPLLSAMRRLVPKHLPVLVTIVDPALERAAAAPPRDEAVALRRLAAMDLLEERRKTFARLRAIGCEAVAVRSDRLARATVGAYLDLKGRGRI